MNLMFNSKIMNKFIFTCLLTLAGFIGISNAQTENYVGAQFVRVDVDGAPVARFDSRTDSFGIVANRTYYFANPMGVTGEVSANFNTGDRSNQLYTGLLGITAKYRGHDKVQPFITGAAGVGILHVNGRDGNPVAYPSRTSTDVAFKVSGGVDAGNGRVKWRVFEAGYLRTNFFNSAQNNFTLSTGVVF